MAIAMGLEVCPKDGAVSRFRLCEITRHGLELEKRAFPILHIALGNGTRHPAQATMQASVAPPRRQVLAWPMRLLMLCCCLALAACAGTGPTTPPAATDAPAIRHESGRVAYHGGASFTYEAPTGWLDLGRMADPLAGVDNRIHAFEGPDGETVRLMFVAGEDWDASLIGPDSALEYAYCPDTFLSLARPSGSPAHCFIFFRGCILARVHTVQLDASWRVFLEYAESVEPMGRSCASWRDPAALDDTQRAFVLLFIRRADTALRTGPAPWTALPSYPDPLSGR